MVITYLQWRNCTHPAKEILYTNTADVVQQSCNSSLRLVKYKTLGYFATTGLKRTFRYRKWLSRSAILETKTSTKFTASFFCLPATGNSTRPPRLDQKPCTRCATESTIFSRCTRYNFFSKETRFFSLLFFLSSPFSCYFLREKTIARPGRWEKRRIQAVTAYPEIWGKR